MCRRHDAATDREGSDVDRVDAEVGEPERGADDVDDRVERPHLVKLDLLEGHTVHFAFRGSQSGEDRERPLAHGGLERATRDQVTDRDVWPMPVVGWVVRVRAIGVTPANAYVELRSCDARALRPLGPDLDTVETEHRHGIADALDRQPEVDQRANGHVTADA